MSEKKLSDAEKIALLALAYSMDASYRQWKRDAWKRTLKDWLWPLI